jgi:hypothetical protein
VASSRATAPGRAEQLHWRGRAFDSLLIRHSSKHHGCDAIWRTSTTWVIQLCLLLRADPCDPREKTSPRPRIARRRRRASK